MRKKGAIDLSARFVVTIIIILVFLILFSFFVKKLFDKAAFRFQQQMTSEIGPVATAVISSPDPSDIYLVSQRVVFDGRESYDPNYKIIGYFWDIDGDFIIDSRESNFTDFYYEPGEYNITLKVVNDEGKIGAASQVVKVYTNNKKIPNLEDSMFFIRDNKDNRDDILRLIPVTTWNDMDGLHNIPFYVYYVKDPSSSLTEGQIKEAMDSYGKTHAYVFDDPNIPCCDFSWGGKIIRVDNIDDFYFGFWELYEYVVLVDPNQEGAFLMASLFAAFYNSPIIFVNDNNLDEFYRNKILNGINTRQVYYIPSASSIGQEVHDFVTSNNIAWIEYSTETLKDPTRRVNRLVKLSSNVTIET